MTGKYAHNHKVVNNFHASEIDQETTLQRYLHAAGYNTALFGKYLNRWEDDIPYFDVWAANNANQRYYNGYWYTSEGEEGTIATYSTSYIKTRAKGFLEEAETRDRKPWFLYLAPMAPHHPFTPEARYVNTPVPYLAKSPAQKERNRSDKPEYVRSQHSNPKRDRQVRRKQLRTLKSVDDMIASVFRTLRRAKETRDTLVFFISDNGFLWGDHLMSRKAVPYTPSIRLEFMARWPGHLPSGKIDKRIAANVDIAPTVAEAVGFPARIRSKMDGRSLFIPNGRDHALMEYEAEASSLDPNKPRKHPPTWASIRTRDYQYIENYGLDGETVRFREFYDLKKDPFQLRNALRDERKENNPSRKLIRSLHRQLARERHCKGTTGTRACP
jgi:arylsulfatase A-like enzyme